jgi:hypothetical protein
MRYDLTAQWIQGIVAVAVAARIVVFRLHRHQPSLLGYLGWVSLASFLLSAFAPSSDTYFRLYQALMVLGWAIASLSVRETIGIMMHDYPGIRTACRWTLYGALAVSVAVSILIGAAFWRVPWIGSGWLYFFFAPERADIEGAPSPMQPDNHTPR